MLVDYGSVPSPRLIETATNDVEKIPTSGKLIIGREPGEPGPGETVWAVLPSEDVVSRRHIEVFFKDDKTTVVMRDIGTEDQGSSSGTLINGRRVPALEMLELRNSDRILLGPAGGVELVFADVVTYSPEDFNCPGGMVYIKGSLLPGLNPAPYKIMMILLERYPDSVSVDYLGDKVWDEEKEARDPRTIQRAVQRLGKRLNDFFDRSPVRNPSIRFVTHEPKGYRLSLFD